VATAGLQARMPEAALGFALEADQRFDPMRRASERWLGALERLDRLAYEQHDLTMPRWAFYDCAELPGLVCGLSMPAEDLPPELVQAIDAGPRVPVSMAMAVPTVSPGHWLVHTLCSVGEVVDGALPPGAGLVTAALATALVDAHRVTATAQWASSKLGAYARLAPLEVRSAYSPAHSVPATCTFRFEIDDARLASALEQDPVGERMSSASGWLDPSNETHLAAMQRAIEAGARVTIVGPPEGRLVPVVEDDA